MTQTDANIDYLSSIPSEVLQGSGRFGRVYDLQLQANQANDRLESARGHAYRELDDARRGAAARGGFGPMGADHEIVEARADVTEARQEVERLSAALAIAQDEVGGIVFLPASENLPRIEKKLAALNRKASAVGTEPITLTLSDEKLVLNYKVNDEDTRGYDFEHVFAVLAGGTPKIPGYEFLASIQPTEHGNLVKRIPAIRYGIAHNLDIEDRDSEGNRRVSTAAQALDSIDLSRFHHTGDTCEHCHKTRSRKDLYVVYNEKTGEAIQVGRTCLRLYMGTDNPEKVLAALEQVQEFIRSMHQRGETRVFSTEDVLTHAAAIMRTSGGEYQRGLGRYAIDNIVYTERKTRDRQNRPMWVDLHAHDEVQARELLNWVRNVWEETGSYAESVKISLAGSHVPDRAENLAASAYAAFKRWQGKSAERAKREQEKAAERPVVEGRIQVTGEVVSTRWQAGYGYDQNVKKMLVRDDRGFKVWGTVPESIIDIERNERVTFTATVERSNDDEAFGFFKRPTKAQIIDSKEEGNE